MELLVYFRADVPELNLRGVNGQPSPCSEPALIEVFGWKPASVAWLWSARRTEADVIEELLEATDCDLVVLDESDVEACRREAGVVIRAASDSG
jgi:hypothetical protein